MFVTNFLIWMNEIKKVFDQKMLILIAKVFVWFETCDAIVIIIQSMISISTIWEESYFAWFRIPLNLKIDCPWFSISLVFERRLCLIQDIPRIWNKIALDSEYPYNLKIDCAFFRISLKFEKGVPERRVLGRFCWWQGGRVLQHWPEDGTPGRTLHCLLRYKQF